MSIARVNAVFGDWKYLLFLSGLTLLDTVKPAFSNVVTIAIDSCIHSAVASAAWFVVSVIMCKDMREDIGLTRREEAAVVWLMSAAVDGDHFIAARSLDMYHATHLATREGLVFHNPFTTIALVLLAHFYGLRPRLAAIIAIAMGSHVLRDATRTGLLLFPVGMSPPVPYIMFIAIMCFVPYAASKYLRRSFQDKGFPVSLRPDDEGESV